MSSFPFQRGSRSTQAKPPGSPRLPTASDSGHSSASPRRWKAFRRRRRLLIVGTALLLLIYYLLFSGEGETAKERMFEATRSVQDKVASGLSASIGTRKRDVWGLDVGEVDAKGKWKERETKVLRGVPGFCECLRLSVYLLSVICVPQLIFFLSCFCRSHSKSIPTQRYLPCRCRRHPYLPSHRAHPLRIRKLARTSLSSRQISPYPPSLPRGREEVLHYSSCREVTRSHYTQ